MSSRWRSATAAASAFPLYEWPWYSVCSERSGPRNASNTGPDATVADIGRYPAVMPLPRHRRSGRIAACSEANSVPVRPKPGRDLVADEQHVVLAARRRRARARSSGAASCIPAAPCTSGSMITAASSGACSRDHRARDREALRVGERGRPEHRKAQRVEEVGAEPAGRPRDSAPIVSPWYAPPNARKVFRPVIPRFTQYWNAIFSACSTAHAPSDA